MLPHGERSVREAVGRPAIGSVVAEPIGGTIGVAIPGPIRRAIRGAIARAVRLGISNDVAMQVVAVGFVISILQDSAETALNSSTDVVFTGAVAQKGP